MSVFSRLSFTLIIATCFLKGFSATKTWNNLAGGSWATNGNWSPNGAPANGDDVIIPALNAGASIDNIPTRTLNSLTFTGTGACILEAATSGNVMTISTSWLIPSGYTLTIGAASARLVWTLASTCTATLNGYCAFDAGTTNRNFTVNGTLIVNASGCLYDPDPTGGSDFYLATGATLRTQKPQGLTITAATSTATINYNVAVCFGGSYSYAGGANYEYNGTAGQITGAGLSQNTPNSLKVNLSAGNTLTLTASTSISGTLNLTSGKVNLNTNILTLGVATTSVGVLSRTADFVFNGTFRRWFATAVVAMPSITGLFPLGTANGDYRPLWVAYSSNLTASGVISAVHTATYPATFINATHSDPSWTYSLQGVSNSVWTISTAALAFNGSTGSIRYGGTGYGSNALTDLDASLVSSVTGTHSAATNANTTIEVNRTNLSTTDINNAWRIGTKNKLASPLPITLQDFKASQKEEKVEIAWCTASEKKTDFFTIERSEDGFTYEPVETVKAAGNSIKLLNYKVIDPNPFQTVNYYRLKQIDLDGKTVLHTPVLLMYQQADTEMMLYPNPSSGFIYIKNDEEKNTITSLEVINSLGKIIYAGGSTVNSIDLEGQTAGVYYLRINYSNKQVVEKFVILK